MSISDYLQENHSSKRIGVVTLDDGKELHFRSLSELERSEYDYQNFLEKDKSARFHRARARLIQMCLLDEDGKRREYGDDGDSLERILGLDSKVTGPLADAISDHCGLNQTLDAAKKNLSNGQTDS